MTNDIVTLAMCLPAIFMSLEKCPLKSQGNHLNPLLFYLLLTSKQYSAMSFNFSVFYLRVRNTVQWTELLSADSFPRKGWGWARMKLGVENSNQVLHDCYKCKYLSHLLWPPKADTSRELEIGVEPGLKPGDLGDFSSLKPSWHLGDFSSQAKCPSPPLPGLTSRVSNSFYSVC